ncbi:MAG: chemotaxis protein CheC [Helicobacteraceae bacterium]|nr:chemotaxis protein CheC [Helicobacteraceae bacterium]
MNNIDFSEDQLDALKEFMNVALGAATANVASLLDAFATMHVPTIEVCNSTDLVPKINKEMKLSSKYYVTKQLFTGKFGGECMFIMQDSSANNLGNYLYDTPNPSQDDINDAVIELTNILSSTIISRLTEELGTQVQFFVPSSQILDAKNIVKYEDVQHYSKIIIISTVLDFKDQKIDGYIYILTKDESIESLKALIDSKLEELYG